MFKVPDDPVPKLESLFFKHVVVIDIKRKHFSIINIITGLPANTSTSRQNAFEFVNNHFLLCKVSCNILLLLIYLAYIVRWRCNHKRNTFIRNSSEKC